MANNTAETQDRFSDSDFTRLIISQLPRSHTEWKLLKLVNSLIFQYLSLNSCVYVCLVCVGEPCIHISFNDVHFGIKMLGNLSENWDSNTGSVCCDRPVFSAAKGG